MSICVVKYVEIEPDEIIDTISTDADFCRGFLEEFAEYLDAGVLLDGIADAYRGVDKEEIEYVQIQLRKLCDCLERQK